MKATAQKKLIQIAGKMSHLLKAAIMHWYNLRKANMILTQNLPIWIFWQFISIIFFIQATDAAPILYFKWTRVSEHSRVGYLAYHYMCYNVYLWSGTMPILVSICYPYRTAFLTSTKSVADHKESGTEDKFSMGISVWYEWRGYDLVQLIFSGIC